MTERTASYYDKVEGVTEKLTGDSIKLTMKVSHVQLTVDNDDGRLTRLKVITTNGDT